MPYIKIYYVLLIFLAIVSCRKDKVPELEEVIPIGGGGDHCPEMYNQRSEAYPDTFHKSNAEMNCIVSPETVYMEDFAYNAPILNPNNAFEFAFIRTANPDEMSWNDELCVYNFCNNKTKILTDKVNYGIDWSVKDWIIFTGKDLQLYKIRSNGDSLTKLTDTGDFNNYARWSPDGTRYLYLDASSNFKICDENGEFLEYTGFSMKSWAWLNEDEIIYSNQGNTELRKYNLETETTSTIVTQIGIAPSGDRISIADNGDIYTTADVGLVRVNQSGSIEVLDTNYVTYSSGYPQVLTENKILLQRFIVDTTYFEDCEDHYATYMSIFDINTNNEKRIKISE
ncbi:MAG: hypothetical protein WEA99_03830 [Brumimicrobium sp.]